MRATNEQIAAMEKRFAQRIGSTALRLPKDDMRRRRGGHVYHGSWHVGYLWGEEDGEEYLELYVQGGPIDDAHVRWWASGREEHLPTPTEWIMVPPDGLPDSDAVAAQNQKLYHELRERGLLPPPGEHTPLHEANQFLVSGGMVDQALYGEQGETTAVDADVWRVKLRSTVEGVKSFEEQVQYCLGRGVVGIGWDIGDVPATVTLQEVRDRSAELSSARGARIVRAFGEEVELGDFVWTRDTHGGYWLGRITGPWYYDGSDEARSADVHQVRATTWSPHSLNDLEVPGAVIKSFTGRGATFAPVKDPWARRLTPFLWAKTQGISPPKLRVASVQELLAHLDPLDLEDVAFVWLQAKMDYLMLPRSRRNDTPAYEWTMVHRSTGGRAIVQIKSGHLDLDELRAAAPSGVNTFAYSLNGEYHGLVGETYIISDNELLDFATANKALLPARARVWFDLVEIDPATEHAV